MQEDEKIILPESEEAAQRETVTGWVSRNGYFFGEDEKAARYNGCTHRICEKCGAVIDKHSYCKACYAQHRIDNYNKMEKQEWNGIDALYSEADDTFFFDAEDLREYCYDNLAEVEDLLLIICVPKYAHEISAREIYEDIIPEEGDIPYALEEKFMELNDFIRENNFLLSWEPGKYAAQITDFDYIEEE